LRRYFDVKEGDPEAGIKSKIEKKVFGLDTGLEKTIAPLQDLFSLKADDKDYALLNSREKREKTFDGLRDLLMRMSQEKPLVIAIDDLHWIDKTSEEFLDYFIGWLANTPIMLILLYRPEYKHQWGSKTYYTKIGINQLGEASSTQLIKAILQENKVAPEVKRIILDRAAGNPLFMEEFTHALLENGTIKKKDQKYVLSPTISDLRIPETVEGIIAARIDRLEENLKQTMQIASMIGREFAFRIINRITGMADILKSCLFELQNLEFIYEKSLFPELEYVFKHALIQEVAYNSVLLKRRKEIHEKIGAAIEEIYADRLEMYYEMIAYHYSRSRNYRKAYHYLKLSGDKAARKHSSLEAVCAYKNALESLDRLPDSEWTQKEKLEIVHLTDFPMLQSGYPQDALPILELGEKLSIELKDNRSLAMLHARMGSHYAFIGKPQVGIKYAQSAMVAAQEFQDIDLIAPVAFEMVAPHSSAGKFFEIVDIAREVIVLIEKADREADFFGKSMNVYSALCARCGAFWAMMGCVEEGKAIIEKGLRNASEIGDIRSLALSELHFGNHYIHRGDGASAKIHYQNCIRYSEKIKWPLLLSHAWSGVGNAYIFLGEAATAKKYIEKGRQIQRDAGINWWMATHYFMLGFAEFELGHYREALRLYEKGLTLSRTNDEKYMEGIALMWLGRIMGKTIPLQFDRAKEHMLEGIHILEGTKTRMHCSQGYLFLGELYLKINEKEKAAQHLKKAEEMFMEMGIDYWLAKARNVLRSI
jgi:tetratricopeptide (TPR) repeat protein